MGVGLAPAVDLGMSPVGYWLFQRVTVGAHSDWRPYTFTVALPFPRAYLGLYDALVFVQAEGVKLDEYGKGFILAQLYRGVVTAI